MNIKTNLLSTINWYTPTLLIIALLTTPIYSANISAAETPAADGQETVGDTFKRTGEYINPNGDGYPTSAKVEYVMGCLAANGMDLINLSKCSCSIDFIASQISYEKYTRADTVLRAQLDQGTKGAVFRESNWAKEMVDELQEVQSASSLECF